jgi:hypothetical protein
MFGISFLNSGILFLTSAIILPVLIYLFARKKPHRIIFSSIRFIKESQQKQRKKINIKNLLLLLIRILIILFTILAISRPAIKAPILKSSKLHPKTGLVIIVDNSYSMNYLVDTQTELEKAKQILLTINELISENDQVILLTLSENWNKINGNIRFGRLPQDLINNIDITPFAIPFKDVLQEAESKLDEVHLPNKEIYFITDLQRRELPEKMAAPTFFISTSQITERYNISCQNVIISNEIVKRNLEKKITFELVNHSTRSQQDVIHKLFLDGNTVAEKVTDMQPKQRKTEVFTINLENAGWHSGYVEVKNELQTYDNRNYFCFEYNPEPQVAILSDKSKLPLVMETILEIYAGEINFLTDESSYNFESLQKYDNIVIYKKKHLSGKLKFILDKLSEQQKGILFLTDRQLSQDWKSYLGTAFKADFQNFVHNTKTRNIDYANKYHPITTLLKNVKAIGINDTWKVKARSNVLLSTKDHPLALENKGSCLWLFDVESLENPFLLEPAFPVFAYNSLVFTSGSRKSTANITIEKTFRLNEGMLELPDGTSLQINKPNYKPGKTGIYKTETAIFAVNLDYNESNYTRLEKNQTKNIQLLGKNWENEVLQSRYGFELWKYLLLFVLILFILEMLIVKKEERK